MIRINLLPQDTVKKSAGFKGPSFSVSGIWPYVLGLCLLYAGSAYAAYWVYRQSDDSKQQVRRAETTRQKKNDELTKKKKEFELLDAISAEIDEKYAVVQGLNPENRIFWSEKLNMLSAARMGLAVYITKLGLDEKVDELETPESIARREAWKREKTHPPGAQEPKPIKRPVINQTLTIDAIAFAPDAPQRLRQIVAFQDSISKLSWIRHNGKKAYFLDGMNPDFGQLPQRLARVGGVEVLRFGFVIKAEPQTSQTAKPASASATATPAAAKKAGR